MKGILWLGFILLFIGVCALLNLFVRGVHWWQFWPLIFVITGVGQMVVPGKEGHRADHFIGGLMQFAFGATILPFTLGIVAWSSLYTIFAHLWPVLIIMCGFFMLGAATHASVFKLLGGLCFVAFCFCGLLWFSLPGLTEAISLLLPTGQVYVFDFEVGIAPLDFDLRPLP